MVKALNNRKSNIELLRILCMIGIVAYHYMQHGGVNGSALLKTSFSFNHVFVTLFGTWGVLGVLTFVIISSYFLSGGRVYKTKKLLDLILQTLFYCLIFLVLGVLLNGFSLSFVMAEILTPFHSQYWFITTYIVFYLMTPYLFKFVNSISLKSLKILCIVLTFIVPCCFVFWEVISSKFVIFVYIYFVTFYLKNVSNNFVEKHCKLLFAISILLLISSSLLVNFIGTYLNNNVIINLVMNINTTYNILFIVSAFSLFYIFKNMKINNSKIINILGKVTIGVYIIHDNKFFRDGNSLLWNGILKTNQYYLTAYFPFHMIISVLLVYIVCSMIEIIRMKIMDQYILPKIKLLNKLCYKFDKWYVVD